MFAILGELAQFSITFLAAGKDLRTGLCQGNWVDTQREHQLALSLFLGVSTPFARKAFFTQLWQQALAASRFEPLVGSGLGYGRY